MAKTPLGRADDVEQLAAQLRALVVATDGYRRSVAEALGIRVSETAALGELLHRGPLTPSALVDRLGLTSPSVTSLLDRLEKAGLAERRRHPTDRRSVLVALTDEGADAIRPTFEMFVDDIGAAVLIAAPEHVVELADALARISDVLRERAADGPAIAADLAGRRAAG
jgi:DNA-binding MarR family transcriptional regulator